MNSSIGVASRAHRCLRHLKRYTPLQSGVESTCNHSLIAEMQDNEAAGGLYDNSNGDCSQSHITTKGLLVFERDTVHRIDFSDISELLSPDSKSVRHLDLRLTNGAVRILPIEGGEGRLRDAFGFLRFLRHVVGAATDLEKAP